jgi:hypothetical protein
MFKCPPSVGFVLACVSSYTTPTCIYEKCLALYWKKWNLPTYITIPLSLLNGNTVMNMVGFCRSVDEVSRDAL